MNLKKLKSFSLVLFVCFKIKSFLSSKKKKATKPNENNNYSKQRKGVEQLGTCFVIDVIISYVLKGVVKREERTFVTSYREGKMLKWPPEVGSG